MTPSELKREHEAAFPESEFFCRENMRFAGDTMRNYGVRKEYVRERRGGWLVGHRDVWELYRKKPVKNGLQTSAYFDRETFKRVFI
jgi:hypothetical protein